MYCGTAATAASAAPSPAAPLASSAARALPAGRPGPTMLARVATGKPADRFAMNGIRFIVEKTREGLDPARVRATNWIAAVSPTQTWPYVPPDGELLLDHVTDAGVAYVMRYASASDPPPPVPHDDPLFVPIQPPVPFSLVDLSICGFLLYTGALQQVVLVSNVRFEERFLTKVSQMNARVASLGTPPDREIRLISFDWDEDSALATTPPSATPPAAPSVAAPSDVSPALTAMRAGNRAAEAGRFDEALRLNDEALRLDPELALAWSNRAFIFSRMRSFERALDAAERAIAVDARLALGWVNKSDALIALNRFPEALAAAQQGLALDARAAPLHFNAALAADRTYKQPLAVTHYRSFVELATPAMKGELEFAQQRLRVLAPR